MINSQGWSLIFNICFIYLYITYLIMGEARRREELGLPPREKKIEADKVGYKYVLRELTKAPWSYKIISIMGRNDWSLRVHVQQGDQDFMLVLLDPNLHRF